MCQATSPASSVMKQRFCPSMPTPYCAVWMPVRSRPDQAYPSLRLTEIGSIEVPLPPLEVQKEIVAEIEGYQKVIDGARSVVDNYRPHIALDPDWPMVPIEEACEIKRGKFSHRPRNEPRFYGGKYPFIQTGDVGSCQWRNDLIHANSKR